MWNTTVCFNNQASNSMTNNPKRIIIACNTSHIIMAKAILATATDNRQVKTILLLADYNHAAELTYQQMDQLAKASPEFDKIHWVNDFVPTTQLTLDANSITIHKQTIQDYISPGHPDDVIEFWTWSIFNRFEQLLAESFLASSIILYEDGLALYVDRGVSEICPENEGCAHWVLNQKGISTHHIDRLTTIPNLLSKYFTLPPYFDETCLVALNKEIYISAMQQAITCFGMRIDQPNKLPHQQHIRNALVIGTPIFDIIDEYTWQDEFTTYKDTIEKLIHKEGFVVYWKEHPSISRPFSSALNNAINNDKFFIVDTPQGAPVEYTAIQLDISKTLSIGSSAQLIMYELFDIPYAVIQKEGLNIVDKAGKSLADFRKESTPYYL